MAVASEAGAVPFTAAETVRRGRLGPGEILLVDPRRRVDPRGHRGEGAGPPLGARSTTRCATVHEDRVPGRSRARRPRPRPRRPFATSPGWTPSGSASTSRRWRSTRTSRSGAWATTRRLPVAGAAGPARRRPPSTVVRPGHEPGDRPRARARRHGHVGRPRPSVGAARRAVARATDRSPGSPFLVDLGRRSSLPVRGRRTPTRRTLDATWDRGRWAGRSRGRAGPPRPGRRRRPRHVIVLSDRRPDGRRLPSHRSWRSAPSTPPSPAAGSRGRTDLAATRPTSSTSTRGDGARGGARAVHPWLAIELAAELAGSRGAEDLTADGHHRLVAAFEAGLRKTLARMGISAVASYIGGRWSRSWSSMRRSSRAASRLPPAWPGRHDLADLAERQLRRRAAAPPSPSRPPAARLACPTQGSPASAPTARPTSSRRRSPARSRPCPATANPEPRSTPATPRLPSRSTARALARPPTERPFRATNSGSATPRRLVALWRSTPGASCGGSSCRR